MTLALTAVTEYGVVMAADDALTEKVGGYTPCSTVRQSCSHITAAIAGWRLGV